MKLCNTIRVDMGENIVSTESARRRRLRCPLPFSTPHDSAHAIVLVSAIVPVLALVMLGIASRLT